MMNGIQIAFSFIIHHFAFIISGLVIEYELVAVQHGPPEVLQGGAHISLAKLEQRGGGPYFAGVGFAAQGGGEQVVDLVGPLQVTTDNGRKEASLVEAGGVLY